MDKLKTGWSFGRWVLVVLISCVMAGASLSRFGVCFKNISYVSDKEKIRSAIEYTLSSRSPDMKAITFIEENGVRKSVPVKYWGQMLVKYKNADEFIRMNPNCCKLVKQVGDGHTGSSIDWFFGYISTWVTVEYEAKYYDERAEAEYSKMDTMGVAVSSCGHAWNGN